MEKLKLVNFGPKLYTKLLMAYPKLNFYISIAKDNFMANQVKAYYSMSSDKVPNNNPHFINNNLNPGNNLMNFQNQQIRYSPMMNNPIVSSSTNQFNYNPIINNNPLIGSFNQNNHLYSNLYNSNYSQNVNFNFYPK